ncbi:MAG: hypothetical protein ACRYFS_09320 [Janthinobacterium lividum]
MTARLKRLGERPPARRALLPTLLCCLLPLVTTISAGADTPKNSISAIRTVVTDGHLITYDITLTSTAEFPMNDSVVTLSIGGTEFINSTYAPGGTLKTLIFTLTRSQFLSLKNGAPVAVYYGEDNAAISAAQWNFGTLDLSLLDRRIITVPIPVAPIKIAAPIKTVTAPILHAATQRKGK